MVDTFFIPKALMIIVFVVLDMAAMEPEVGGPDNSDRDS